MQPTQHNESSQLVQVGARTTLRITKLLPFGLAGILPDGSRGIVREREIAWDEAIRQNWRERFVVGHRYPATVVEKRPESWELSLRLAQHDPWSKVEERYLVGLAVTGRVARFWNYAAMLELEPGITGVLRQNELPPWVTQPIDEALWVGDRVRAVIGGVNHERREIELSAKELLPWRWGRFALKEKKATPLSSVAESNHDSLAQLADPSASSPLLDFGHHAILVIEDDAQQNTALCRWLKNAGQIVQGVHSAEEGLALLQQHHFDYLLCDLRLPAVDGITAIQQALRSNSDLHGILMTDWATADQRQSEIADLEAQGILLLLKPILPEELCGALERCKHGKRARHPLAISQLPAQMIGPAHKHRVRSHKKDFLQLLHNLREQTRASKVVLFQFDAQNRTIQIAGQSGAARLNEEATPRLIYSPVRDVAEDGVIIHMDDVAAHEGYVRHLKPLLRFRSCVGVPLILNQEQRYALLLFHSETGFTGSVVEQEAQATAMQIRALLEQQRFVEQAAELQRTVLLGHLSRALIHETNHQLNPILFNLHDLQRQCAQVQKSIEQKSPQANGDVIEAKRMLQQLTDSIQQLVKTTRMFGRVTVQDQEELVRVDRVVEQAIELVRDLADRARVKLHVHPPPAPLITQTKFIQVQQVLLNLLLNAIQQIETIRPQEGGQVHLSFMITQSEESVDMIRVLVEDDGPGIHQRLWERIFELGMTTRQGKGSGMGLFIARRLSENAGGQVFVDYSMPFWGTRMAVEFPIYRSV
jgi:signal transduction histidine kinase/ActR/RegA family two-component response regulator/predicted RNA-binding protein with RPS1 domain